MIGFLICVFFSCRYRFNINTQPVPIKRLNVLNKNDCQYGINIKSRLVSTIVILFCVDIVDMNGNVSISIHDRSIYKLWTWSLIFMWYEWYQCNVKITFHFNDWLIDWLFTVLRPSQELFTYMETSPLQVKGCKILCLCPVLRAFQQGGIVIVLHLLRHAASVFQVLSEGPSNLIASYDTWGNVEDLLYPRSSRGTWYFNSRWPVVNFLLFLKTILLACHNNFIYM
jgi:hypothetical protein